MKANNNTSIPFSVLSSASTLDGGDDHTDDDHHHLDLDHHLDQHHPSMADTAWDEVWGRSDDGEDEYWKKWKDPALQTTATAATANTQSNTHRSPLFSMGAHGSSSSSSSSQPRRWYAKAKRMIQPYRSMTGPMTMLMVVGLLFVAAFWSRQGRTGCGCGCCWELGGVCPGSE